MRLLTGIVGTGWLVAACATTAVVNSTPSPSAEVVEPAPAKPSPDQRPDPMAAPVAAAPQESKDECPVRRTVCPMDYNPMVCSARSYDRQVQPTAGKWMAWGPNGCAARLNLWRSACAQELLPSKLGSIQCVPDATRGHCPPKERACVPLHRSTRCSAASYGAQRLSSDLIVVGTGSNDCAARAALAMEACRRNLDPEQLQAISCLPQSDQVKAPAAGAKTAAPPQHEATK